MLHKQILHQLLLYATPIWGNCANTHINKIQVFHMKELSTISNAPWFVRNEALHKDFQLPTITIDIKEISTNYFNYLNSASSA